LLENKERERERERERVQLARAARTQSSPLDSKKP
jgi:hypothetical protein